MITREDIIQIYQNRDERLFEWIKDKPEKKTISQLKKDLKKWQKEIFDAQKFAKENDPLFPKDSIGTAYTFMNISSAIFANYVIATQYILKLENKLKSMKKSSSKSDIS
jgi:hypothetical protein